jgi:protein SCO1/2
MASIQNTSGGPGGSSWLLLTAIAALSFVLGALVALLVVPGARERLLPAPTSDQTADVGGPFAMLDHRGQRVSERDFRGRLLLMTFSYTRSPDIGPAQLQLMAEVINRLGSRGEAVVPILVTLDPERDGPAELRAYLARFHPRFVGLTGTKEQVAAMARSWHVPFDKRPVPGDTTAYEIDHPALIYLMGTDGTYIAHFGPGTGIDAVTRQLGSSIYKQ